MSDPTPNWTDVTVDELSPPNQGYSEVMVDTIFADTLSKGMQNSITSQLNAQMASSAAITNACAKILQAKANPVAAVPAESQKEKKSNATTEPLDEPVRNKSKSPRKGWLYALSGLALGLVLALAVYYLPGITT